MANFNLVVNSKFQPISFERYIKPYQLYGEAYKAIEDDYTNLALQTEAFKNEANREINPDAFELYNKFSTDLNAAMDDFNKDMTSSSRKRLLEMKRRYAGEIKPIAKASEALKAANDFRDKAGPDAIFKVHRYNSLDNFLNGQIADNTYTSAKQLSAQASAKALTAGPQLYREIQAGGDTPIMTALYNDLWNDAGGDSYDDDGKAKLHEAIMAGINSAAYTMYEENEKLKLQKQAQKRADATLEENMIQRNIELHQNGYKLSEDGKSVEVDKESPYWRLKGITFKDDGQVIVDTTPDLIPTEKEGVFYNKKTHKYQTSDGAITTDPAKEELEVDYTPLYFETNNKNATKGLQTIKQGADPKMAIKYRSKYKEIPITEIEGEDSKQLIKSYINEMYGYASDSPISDEILEKISEYLVIERDNDWFNDDHFSVRIKGVNVDGGVETNQRDNVKLRVKKIKELLEEDSEAADKV